MKPNDIDTSNDMLSVSIPLPTSRDDTEKSNSPSKSIPSSEGDVSKNDNNTTHKISNDSDNTSIKISNDFFLFLESSGLCHSERLANKNKNVIVSIKDNVVQKIHGLFTNFNAQF